MYAGAGDFGRVIELSFGCSVDGAMSIWRHPVADRVSGSWVAVLKVLVSSVG